MCLACNVVFRVIFTKCLTFLTAIANIIRHIYISTHKKKRQKKKCQLTKTYFGSRFCIVQINTILHFCL